MSRVRNTTILPSRLREWIVLLRRQIAQARRDKRLVERNRRIIDALLASSSPIKLELGAGENRGIAGWTYADANENCDLTLDLTGHLPFPDNSVDMIYSSHLLEHFVHSDLIHFLKECLRVLTPGGVFSTAVPNARIYLDAYQTPKGFDPDIFCRYRPAYHYNSRIDYVNYIAYMDGKHRYMFDEENLVVILAKSGFRNVRLRDFDETLDMEVRDFQTIYAYGIK